MAPRKSRRGIPKAPLVPTWLLILLATAMAGLFWARRGESPPQPPSPPARSHPVPPVEPPPFPETPPEERPPKEAPRQIPAPVPPVPLPPPAKVAATSPPAGPRIAIVLDDVGYKFQPLEEACGKLPQEITFAVLPHLPASGECDAFLHQRGFPVILHAPMEPGPGNHPGPGQGALLVGMPAAEVGFLLDQDLARVPHAEGLNNHMGSKATADPVLMREVMAFLRSKGLYFLDSRTTTASVAFRIAREEGIPAAEKALFLDDEDVPESISRYLALLVERARKNGDAVGIGHLRPNTVAVLAEQIPLWRERGVRFVPLREVMR